MITAIIVLLVLFIVSYQRTSIRKRDIRKPLHKQYGKPIILLLGTFVPIIFFNIYRPQVDYTPEREYEDALKSGKEYRVHYALEKLAKKHPDSIPLQMKFLENYVNYFTYSPESYKSSDYTPKAEIQDLLNRHYIALRSPQFGPTSGFTRDSLVLETSSERFFNYVDATFYFRIGNIPNCEKCLQAEIEINPDFSASYQLYYKVLQDDQERLKEFLLNEDNAKHIDLNILIDEYYRLGTFFPYVKSLYKRTFYDPDIFAVIAGLLISLIWLLFLRSMDMFNKERWIDILTVFFSGVIITTLCLIFYDVAEKEFGFSITGDPFNDFWYCVGVIGFSEEFIKLIPWVVFAIFSRKIKEPYDYILYACASALGFAFTENLYYLEESHNISGRSVLSTVGHMFDATLVAYGLILAKYRCHQIWKKIGVILLFFFLSCLSHGFYDYLLISPAQKGKLFITIIFFLLSLHFWMFMMNNAMNNSSFYDFKSVNIRYPKNLISYGLICIVVLQYCFISYEDGAKYANLAMQGTSWIVVSFILYMELVFDRFKSKKGKWNKLNFVLPNFVSSWLEINYSGNEDSEDHAGLQLRFFSPKNNQHVGELMPITGICISSEKVSGNSGWYRVHLDQPLSISLYHQHTVLVKPKIQGMSLSDDKIEIYFMIIPRLKSDLPEEFDMDKLRYTGRVYSRPVQK